jgi:hypothetical protein
MAMNAVSKPRRGLLEDPVPRVRKMAMHALECERCNPDEATIAARRRILALRSRA